MRVKDYFRLSKINLKAKKKSTKSTVRGISFGLILLIPLVFICLAFYIDLNKQVNKDETARIFNVKITNQDYYESYAQWINSKYINDINNLKNINCIRENMIYRIENSLMDKGEKDTNNTPTSYVLLDGKKIFLDKQFEPDGNSYGKDFASFYNIDLSFFKPNENNKYLLNCDKNILAGNDFSINAKKEIMVSDQFLKDYNLNSSVILNKEISLVSFSRGYSNITLSKTSNERPERYEGSNITIFNKYKVVGIFDGSTYSANYYNQNSYSSSKNYFWLTYDSLQSDNGDSNLPELLSFEIPIDKDNHVQIQRSYYYPNGINDFSDLKDGDLVFLPLGLNCSKVDDIFTDSRLSIEFKSYDDAMNAKSIIENLYKQSSSSDSDIYSCSNFSSNIFQNYSVFYKTFLYLSIGLGIFGGIIFFATILNLYNTIHYSVNSRKNYLGLLRAVGMHNRDIIKLYFVEIFMVFRKSYFWSILFGGGICALIIFLFDEAMNSEYGSIISIKISLNYIYIFASFGILFVINTIISVIFALVATNNVSRKPVLEVLVDEK